MKRFQRGYPLMASTGKKKSHFQRTIRIKAAKVEVSTPALKLRKTMTAHNEFWRESAQWERRGGIWICTGGTGVLSRLKGMNPDQAKLELLRLGADWKWV